MYPTFFCDVILDFPILYVLESLRKLVFITIILLLQHVKGQIFSCEAGKKKKTDTGQNRFPYSFYYTYMYIERDSANTLSTKQILNAFAIKNNRKINLL